MLTYRAYMQNIVFYCTNFSNANHIYQPDQNELVLFISIQQQKKKISYNIACYSIKSIVILCKKNIFAAHAKVCWLVSNGSTWCRCVCNGWGIKDKVMCSFFLVWLYFVMLYTVKMFNKLVWLRFGCQQKNNFNSPTFLGLCCTSKK